MNPVGLFVGGFVGLSGLGLGMLGLVDGIPALAGGGFAVTAGLQLWTMGKLGPVMIRLAVIEERLNRIESDLGHRRHGNMHHTPNVE